MVEGETFYDADGGDDDDNGDEGLDVVETVDMGGNADIVTEEGEGGVVELVSEPRKAEKIGIDFAKRAKLVDVRALKEHIWKDMEKQRRAGKGFVKLSGALFDVSTLTLSRYFEESPAGSISRRFRTSKPCRCDISGLLCLSQHTPSC